MGRVLRDHAHLAAPGAEEATDEYLLLGDRSGVDLRYPALLDCLTKLAELAAEHGASVHMPRIGCGLVGGRWDEVEPLIVQTLCAAKIAVTVYDFRP